VKKIGLFLISHTTGYQRLMADEGLRAARQAGLDLEVFWADDTAALQSAQIVKFLHAHGGDEMAVVVMPVSDIGHEAPLDNLARKVLSRGAAWIVLNRDLEPHVLALRAEFPRLPVALVAIDNREIGRIQGRQVKARLPADGALLVVVGSATTSAARDRRAGLLEVATRPVVVSEVEAMWSAESADKAVARWLTLARAQEVQLVACQNDPMAVGARQALHRLARERGRPELLSVPVLGVDGLAGEGRRLVDEGTLAATVIVPPSAGAAIERLAVVWRSGGSIPPKVVLQPTPYPA
jgi:ribose transport system substrate-binding protein